MAKRISKEAVAAIEQSTDSCRVVAARIGVSKSSVGRILHQNAIVKIDSVGIRFKAVKKHRCPGCGGMVVLAPCPACLALQRNNFVPEKVLQVVREYDSMVGVATNRVKSCSQNGRRSVDYLKILNELRETISSCKTAFADGKITAKEAVDLAKSVHTLAGDLIDTVAAVVAKTEAA